MRDRPVERSSSISDRRMVSSIPSARRSFKVVAVSSASSPETTWPRVVASESGHVVGRDLAIGVQDVDQESLGGTAGNARKVGANAVTLALALVACLAVPGEDGRAATFVRDELERGLIASDAL